MKTRRCLITASGLLITLTVGLISYASSALASDQPKQAPAAALLPLTTPRGCPPAQSVDLSVGVPFRPVAETSP